MTASILRDDPDTLGWNVFSERYADHEQHYHTITAETLNALLRAEIVLDEFMRHGCHLWDGFDGCMEAVEKRLSGSE